MRNTSVAADRLLRFPGGLVRDPAVDAP